MTGDEVQEFELRASDADRDRTLDVLREQLTQGRLTHEEFDERSGLALAARTVGELAVLTRDLPQQSTRLPVRRSHPGQIPRGAVKAFRIHAGTYGVMQAFFTGIWALTDLGGYFWPIWPALGWGVGLAIHGVVTASLRRPDHPGGRDGS